MSDDGRRNMDELRGWLTVPQILEDLQVSAEEWHAWRKAGDTPVHVRLPDGTLRVNSAEYNMWVEDSAVDRSDTSRGSASDASAEAASKRPRLSLVPALADDAGAVPVAPEHHAADATGTDSAAPAPVRLHLVPPARGEDA